MPEADPRYWDEIAPQYDTLYNDEWSRLEDEATRDMIKASIASAGRRVLDIGCGTGFGYELCKRVATHVDYIGIDLSPQMLNVASERFPDARFIHGNAGKLDIGDLAPFDVVMMLNGVLSFVECAETILLQASAHLRCGGRIVTSGLARFSIRRLLRGRVGCHEQFATRGTRKLARSTRARVFASRELRRLLTAAGYEDVRIRGIGVFAGVLQLPALWRIDQLLCRALPGQAHLLWGTGVRR